MAGVDLVIVGSRVERHARQGFHLLPDQVCLMLSDMRHQRRASLLQHGVLHRHALQDLRLRHVCHDV